MRRWAPKVNFYVPKSDKPAKIKGIRDIVKKLPEQSKDNKPLEVLNQPRSEAS